ncbi:MAG: hypothetical protein CMN28_06545 [Salinisphaeraceae bacterium]|nr:hypothetical protein [Salinisphaeraceae bacterium]
MNAWLKSAGSRSLADRRSQRGATLIEFTLILPALLALLIGGTLFGLVLVTQQAVTHAAESAVGAVLSLDPETTDPQGAGFLSTAQTLAQSRVNRRLTFLPGSATASVLRSDPIVDAGGAPVNAGTQFEVTVTYPFTNWNLGSGYLPVPDIITGRGSGVIR